MDIQSWAANVQVEPSPSLPFISPSQVALPHEPMAQPHPNVFNADIPSNLSTAEVLPGMEQSYKV
jgi:hypothetical protein